MASIGHIYIEVLHNGTLADKYRLLFIKTSEVKVRDIECIQGIYWKHIGSVINPENFVQSNGLFTFTDVPVYEGSNVKIHVSNERFGLIAISLCMCSITGTIHPPSDISFWLGGHNGVVPEYLPIAMQSEKLFDGMLPNKELDNNGKPIHRKGPGISKPSFSSYVDTPLDTEGWYESPIDY